ncbi:MULTISPECIES: hypothetical protein [Citrobacter]|uniref:hypothetical protein n=1 Tax=Citrobacter TaxID=544 RepID=UPI001E32A8D0|nr:MULTISPECIES: hypothetical protein [Citrobacter]
MDRRRTDHADSVIAQLKAEPWRFSLEQCVRILEAAGETPELRGDLGLAFSPAEVSSLNEDVVQVRSLGPGGADGVLPYSRRRRIKTAHCRILSLCFNSVFFNITTVA